MTVIARALVATVLVLWAHGLEARQAGVSPDAEDLGVATLLERIETAVSTSNRALWMATLSPNADRQEAREFFDVTLPQGLTRAVLRERDRQPLVGTLPGDGYRLVVEVFLETGARGRLATWMLDIRRPAGATPEPDDRGPGGLRTPWRVVGFDRLSAIDGLHRLALHPERQFAAQRLVIRSVDFELRLTTGDVFVVETAEGITGLVLLGNGTMHFTPTPPTERGQVRIFSGSETIDTPFDTAFVRLNPFEFEQRVSHDALDPVAVEGRAFARARAVFDEEATKSFTLDLHDLSPDTWSLLPQGGDFIAEVRTRRFRTLTYARATGEAEDVSLFQRQTRKNISVYPSPQKLASRGFYYNEDDLAEYDILDHEIDVTFDPDREWLDGRSRLRLRVRAHALGALTLRLHEHFRVASITSRELGRLLFLRVRNQNSVVVNLPTAVPRDFELTLSIVYRGRVERQAIDQESSAGQRGRQLQRPEDIPLVPPEPNWLLSNRNYWYPQAPVSDYATATLRVTVPGDLSVVASGELVGGSPVPVTGGGELQMYTFRASRPVRYLSMMASRMTRVDAATVALEIEPRAPPSRPATGKDTAAELPPVGALNTVHLAIEANRRQEQRGRDLMMTAAEILRFYASIVGDMPFESFTIGMVEHDLPGGHSPAYFAVLNNPLPTTPFTWHNDPASFRNFPEFIAAHEIAHQWWGQAVGWKNYHEQWLSEGFAQYFAALYAQEYRGDQTFRDILRQFRRWGTDQAHQGPISLGYRLGHIRNDTRVFRALVYNKGAAVLHMLRRFVGDEAFFSGLRQFYAEHRYRKAGTDDLQKAMEAASGRALDRFFERWVFDVTMPRVRFTTSTTGETLIVRYEQIGDVFDVPVTATLQYTNGRSEDVVILVTEASGEQRVPLSGPLRTVDFNRDDGAIGTFDRR